MTTKFALSKFYCRCVSHEKQRFWTILLPASQATTPPSKAKMLFLLSSRRLWAKQGKEPQKDKWFPFHAATCWGGPAAGNFSYRAMLSVIVSQDFCVFVFPALLQKLVGDFLFFDFSHGDLAGILRDFLLTHRIKAHDCRGKFWGIFRKKIRSSEKNLSCKIHSADVPP